jgi:N6-adenosine-specific RNA methylase IME4
MKGEYGMFTEAGPFDVVVMDPPWPMRKIIRKARPNQIAFDYPVMPLDQIRAFWHAEMADKIKPDCHLFIWTTQKYLPPALDMLARFGFGYDFPMIWIKPGGFQPWGLPQYNVEFIVYGRRGAPVFTDGFEICNAWPRREHSRKPTEFYELIARITSGKRIDVFARERHQGFAQYGNEIDRFETRNALNETPIANA